MAEAQNPAAAAGAKPPASPSARPPERDSVTIFEPRSSQDSDNSSRRGNKKRKESSEEKKKRREEKRKRKEMRDEIRRRRKEARAERERAKADAAERKANPESDTSVSSSASSMGKFKMVPRDSILNARQDADEREEYDMSIGELTSDGDYYNSSTPKEPRQLRPAKGRWPETETESEDDDTESNAGSDAGDPSSARARRDKKVRWGKKIRNIIPTIVRLKHTSKARSKALEDVPEDGSENEQKDAQQDPAGKDIVEQMADKEYLEALKSFAENYATNTGAGEYNVAPVKMEGSPKKSRSQQDTVPELDPRLENLMKFEAEQSENLRKMSKDMLKNRRLLSIIAQQQLRKQSQESLLVKGEPQEILHDTMQRVQIRVIYSRIGDIDTIGQQFVAEICIYARWAEPNLKGLSEQELDEIPFESCWKPKLVLLNMTGGMEKDRLSINVRYEEEEIHPVVSFMWEVKAMFTEPMELEHFPFDTQELSVVISSERPMDEIDLVPDTKALSGVNPNAVRDTQEWKSYQHVEFTQDFRNSDLNSSSMHPVIIAAARVRRRLGFYIWNIFIIVFLIIGLSLTILSIDPTGGDRLGVTMTLFLTCVAFKLVVKTTLPHISYLTYLDIYVVFTMMYLAAQAAENAIISHLARFRKRERVIWYDEIAQSILLGLLILFHAVFLIYIRLTAFSRRREMNEKDHEYQLQVLRMKNKARTSNVMKGQGDGPQKTSGDQAEKISLQNPFVDKEGPERGSADSVGSNPQYLRGGSVEIVPSYYNWQRPSEATTEGGSARDSSRKGSKDEMGTQELNARSESKTLNLASSKSAEGLHALKGEETEKKGSTTLITRAAAPKESASVTKTTPQGKNGNEDDSQRLNIRSLRKN